ncbi:MAG: nicotinate-nucleotide adenylyltransferase [Bacteroidetes bacterium]|nr:nicotinate-nucleotide adenylyltransferase [Bacteroidota bacterium]
MKIGLYFGTFNPIHVGHLIIANHMAEYSGLDQIWMMVTPHNPHKKKETLLNDYLRLDLVYLATEDYPKIKPSDFEFKLPQPNYTVNTLAHLQDKYPDDEFSLIMGEDNLRTLHKWKNYEAILAQHRIYVYPRMASEATEKETILPEIAQHLNIHKINAPVVEISSTAIREGIKNRKNVRPLLPEKVWKEIDKSQLYY